MPVVIPVIPVLALAFIACVSWLCGRRAGPLAALLVWAGAVAIGVAITALAFMLSPGKAWPDLLGAAVVLLLALAGAFASSTALARRLKTGVPRTR